MVRHILFPADFSPPCHAFTPTVAGLARRMNARVTTLHVFEAPSYAGVAYELLELESVRKIARRQLEVFGVEDFAGLSVERELRDGRSAEVITAAASELRADLIAMPTIGYTKLRALLLGSVTSAVLHDADVPVLTGAHTDSVAAEPRFEPVVCAVDFGGGTAEVLRWARLFGSRATAVHVVPAVDERFGSGAAERAHRFLCDDARQRWAALEGTLGIDFEVSESPGSVADGLVAAAQKHHAGLLIAGRGRAQGLFGRLRSNIHELIRKSSCPVLSA
jgi:nucleotide-binding universal stress UspA family protein